MVENIIFSEYLSSGGQNDYLGKIMLSPIEELKIQSKKLLKSWRQDNNSSHVNSLKKQYSHSFPQLKLCQHYIAHYYGFSDWLHAKNTLDCQWSLESDEAQSVKDFGTFWYSNQCVTLLNRWCSTYQEAIGLLEQTEGFLLPYKQQYMVVSSDFVKALNMSPKDEGWRIINFNWCHGQIMARQRLALSRIQNNAIKL